MKSCLFTGTIEHRRFSPVHHEFRYGVCYFYLDLDELDQGLSLPFPLSWSRKNYIHPIDRPIKVVVAEAIKKHTGEEFSGKIRMLTMPSYFGFCFNPVSFYYCFDQDERLKFIVSEVTNTPWKQRNTEVYPFRGDNKTVQQHPKTFHVSPFMQMEIDYTFVLNRPEDDVYILMQNRPTAGKEVIFDSTFELKRKEMTGMNLFLTLLRYPAMPFFAVAGIYWQALLLFFIRKTPFHSHPDNNARIGD